jgi:phage shock protein C
LTAGKEGSTIVGMARGRLYRSTTDRQIAGVCGGLADYFNIDGTLVRIAFVVAAFTSVGLLAYIVLWIAVPEASVSEEGEGTRSAQPWPTSAPYSTSASSAIRIAEERYARGEITAGELARIRADLRGES